MFFVILGFVDLEEIDLARASHIAFSFFGSCFAHCTGVLVLRTLRWFFCVKLQFVFEKCGAEPDIVYFEESVFQVIEDSRIGFECEACFV